MDEQNPLRRQIETELQESEWFQKFKTWGTFFNRLKTEVPLTQLCKLQWITDCDDLYIHCPNPEVRAALNQQVQKIRQLNPPTNQIILKHSDYADIVIA